MKLETFATKTTVGGATEAPKKFTIAANAVAFNVLSSKLYNDKIRAIIRELACNAWDAHVMAGTPQVPFEIHLPTDFEPYFRIKDHGVGMSHEEVQSLYCTYFASSKNDNNDTIGAMGLGSKSPFCYTLSNADTMDATQGFTVVSYHEGKKRIYSAYVEGGAPTIVCLNEEDTQEPNGFEVEFAVNLLDIWEFENKAKLALEFFQPMPVVNVEGFEPVRAEYAIRTELWGLRKEPRTAETNGLRAIQGNVQYAVGTIDSSRMTPEQYAVFKLPLDIFFQIGDLSVATSREMLSNDQRTITNILNALTAIHKSVVAEIKTKIAGCKFAWEARIQLMHILATPLGDIIRDAYNAGEFFGKYETFMLSKDLPRLNELDYEYLQVTKYSRTGTKLARKKALFEKRNRETRQLVLDQIKTKPDMKTKFFHEIEVDGHVVCILNDLGRVGNRVVQAYIQANTTLVPTNGYRTAYLFSPMESGKSEKRMRKEFQKAMDALGNPPHVLASWIRENHPLLMKALETARKPRQVGILECTGNGRTLRGAGGWRKHTWSRVAFESLDAGRKFYVPVQDYIVVGDRFKTASGFTGFIANVKASNQFNVIQDKNEGLRVYGLKPKEIEVLGIEKNPDWVPFFDYVQTQAAAVITPDMVLRLSMKIKPFQCRQESLLRRVLTMSTMKDSPLYAFAKSYMAGGGKKSQYSDEATANVIRVLQGWNIKFGKTVDFAEAWRELVLDRYPMLGLNSSEYSSIYGLDYYKTLVDYIKLMDSQEEAV